MVDWKDSFEDQFNCKVIERGQGDPTMFIKMTIDRDEIPSLSDVGDFFSREVPDTDMVIIKTKDGAPRTHIRHPNGNWSYAGARD